MKLKRLNEDRITEFVNENATVPESINHAIDAQLEACERELQLVLAECISPEEARETLKAELKKVKEEIEKKF